jgi:hypothetical protein
MYQLTDFQRTVIIGNGGSGKSWLAEQLSRNLSVPAIDLDVIHWEPGGYNVMRDKSLAIEMVRRAAEGPDREAKPRQPCHGVPPRSWTRALKAARCRSVKVR